MKSNKKTKKRRTQYYRTRQYKNIYNKTKNKKQYGGNDPNSLINHVNNKLYELNNNIQNVQMNTSSNPDSQLPGDGVVEDVKNSGDTNTPIGRAIEKTFGTDDTDEAGQSDQSAQPAQPDQLQKYLEYIQANPTFIQSTLSNVVVKPTAYLIRELGSLLNIEMNNPDKLKTQLDEMANSIQDPVERKKVLNYNAQVLAVYLTASKPSIDIISGIFSQEVSQILSDIIYNMSMSVQNMIPGLGLLNDIPQMLISIVQAMTTLAQLTSTGATSTQQNIQELNKSIMNEVDVKNKLVIEQKKQAEILEKQNNLVEFILEKPEIINSYIQYLNKFKNEKITINDIIPNSETNMTGGKIKTQPQTRTTISNKDHDIILNAIKESLSEYNKNQSK